jgi:hypothetical protein
MWPAPQTRPDIAYVTGLLARYLANPTEKHVAAAKHDFRYLKNDKQVRDMYEYRDTTSGYLYMLAGGPIAWKSGRQPIVTLSSTEAEYVALTIAAKEAIALRGLLDELGYQGHDLEPVQLFEDNLPAIDLTKRPATDGRSKHIEIRWHYIKQAIRQGLVDVSWVATEEQAADGFTKALDSIKFKRFLQQLNLVDCSVAIMSHAGKAIVV